MNRFKNALGFTIFVSMVAPVVAMHRDGFGLEPFGVARAGMKSEQVLTYEAQLAARRNNLRSVDSESSVLPTALPDSPDTQADQIFNEFLRREELGGGSGDSATSSADERANPPIHAPAPEQSVEKQPEDTKIVPASAAQVADHVIAEPEKQIASAPRAIPPQLILPESDDASSAQAVRGENSTNGLYVVSEDEEEGAPEKTFFAKGSEVAPEDEEGPIASVDSIKPIHPLEPSPEILSKGDDESLASADTAALDSDEDVQEASDEVGEEFSEEEVVQKMEEEVAVVLGTPVANPDVQDPEVLELNPAPAQKVPESAAPKVLDVANANGANNNAQLPKVGPAVKPAQSATPAWKRVKEVPGYFTANYLKKDNARDMSLNNLKQHKLNLFITFVLYAATASAVSGVVYGIANWFKKAGEPAEPDAVPVKRPMVVKQRA